MRKSRVNLPNRCYHLISRVAHRAFFLDDEERTRLMGSGDSPRVGIFRRHPERIFQWEENRSVPAENNMSERGVRRTVIARKVCGGSQSNDALLVREVLQSVIESLRLRCADPVAKLTEALDANAMDPGICIPDLLFPLPTHKAELSRRRAGTRRVLKSG